MKDASAPASPVMVSAPPPGPPPPDPTSDRDDAAILTALRRGEAAAAEALFDRYARHVRVVLVRVLGVNDREHADLLHEVFVRALERVHQLKDARALKAWLTSIAVFTARATIRSRSRRRWLVFGEAVPEQVGPPLAEESGEAVRELYDMLRRFPADERIAFALRHIDGMELEELAGACRVSLSTVRRRLGRADELFRRLLGEYPALQERLGGKP